MERNIFVALSVMPVIALASFSSVMVSAADSCDDLDMQEVREVMDAQRNGETLSATQQNLLTLAESCRPDGQGERGTDMKNGSGALDGQRPEFDAEKLDGVNKTLSTSSTSTTNPYASKISSSYKTLLDTRAKAIIAKYEDYDTDDQIDQIDAFITKIKKVESALSASSSYTSTQKTLYGNVFGYLRELLTTYRDGLDSGEEVDDILENLLGL